MPELDQTKLIDKYERVFAEAGWKEIVEDFKERQRQLKDRLIVDKTITDRMLGVAQGQNDVYDFIINLETTIEAVKQAQAENAQEQAYLPDIANAD